MSSATASERARCGTSIPSARPSSSSPVEMPSRARVTTRTRRYSHCTARSSCTVSCRAERQGGTHEHARHRGRRHAYPHRVAARAAHAGVVAESPLRALALRIGRDGGATLGRALHRPRVRPAREDGHLHRPRGDQGHLHRRRRRPPLRRGRRAHPRPDPRRALDPAPRRRPPPRRAASHEPAVPRRAHARLRPPHARDRRPGDRTVARRAPVPDPPRDAIDHPRRDPACRLRVDEGAAFTRVREQVERFVAQANGPSAPFIALKPFQIDLGRWTPWGRFVRNRAAIRAVLLDEIARRRAEGTAGRSDILSLLVDARDEQGAPMSDAELLDEMFTLLMAGQETTATSLAWVFYHLLRHPDALASLRAELARVVGSGPVEVQHLPQLEYLDAVTKESARLTPVATNVMRRLHAPARNRRA